MPHHLMLVSLDALRADHLGCRGSSAGLSPTIDALAQEALLFDNATSPATWTLPAHMSMLSGLEPPIHGCVSALHHYPPETLPFPLVFELLAAGGYDPLAVTGGGYMDPGAGFGRGAPEYHVARPVEEALELAVRHAAAHDRTFTFLHTYLVHDYPRVSARPAALRRAREQFPRYAGIFATERDFLSLLADLATSPEHPPVSAEDLGYLRALYAEAVRDADRAVRSLVYRLDGAGRLEDTTLVLTSDHGESLGELHSGRRYWSHGGPPYQEQARVPLLVRPARHLREALPPARLSQWVSLCDLTPTLLELAEIPYDRSMFDGRSVLDLCAGQIAAFETRELFFHSCEDPQDRLRPPRSYGTGFLWRDEAKVILDHRTGALRELYRLQQDPAERHNSITDLSRAELSHLDETAQRYWEHVAARAHHPPSRLVDDPEVLARLVQLGYLDP